MKAKFTQVILPVYSADVLPIEIGSPFRLITWMCVLNVHVCANKGACVRVCVRACVRVCVLRACVCDACVHVTGSTEMENSSGQLEKTQQTWYDIFRKYDL